VWDANDGFASSKDTSFSGDSDGMSSTSYTISVLPSMTDEVFVGPRKVSVERMESTYK
jgi:hypothetical protein